MIIHILDQSYNCGSNRGLNEFVSSGILHKLNKIIDWKNCSWPRRLKKVDTKDNKTINTFVEDTNFLGENPELRPGNCFLFNGQIIAIDSPDRLVLIISETGSCAMDRIYKEWILPEFEVYDDIGDVILPNTKVEEISADLFENSSLTQYKNLPIEKKNILSQIIGDRYFHVVLDSTILLSDTELFISSNKILYNEADLFDDSIVEEVINEVLSLFIHRPDEIFKDIEELKNGDTSKETITMSVGFASC